MITDILKALDLRDEDTQTYLAMANLGASTATEIAKHMGIARPTVYGYLERLQKIGLISEGYRGAKKVFIPERGDKIRQLYKRKIDDLKTKEKSLDDLIPLLEKSAGLNFMRPKMQFFEGRHGMETALQDNLKYKDAKMLAFWSIKSAIEATSEDLFWYLNKERIKNNMSLEAIWPHNQKINVKHYPFMGVGKEFKREIRLAPADIESSMGYWIYANKVLFTSSRQESFCFIIESEELVQMMSMQHKVIWNLSTPISAKYEDMKPFLDDLYERS